jgi:hypothetical protein
MAGFPATTAGGTLCGAGGFSAAGCDLRAFIGFRRSSALFRECRSLERKLIVIALMLLNLRSIKEQFNRLYLKFLF